MLLHRRSQPSSVVIWVPSPSCFSWRRLDRLYVYVCLLAMCWIFAVHLLFVVYRCGISNNVKHRRSWSRFMRELHFNSAGCSNSQTFSLPLVSSKATTSNNASSMSFSSQLGASSGTNACLVIVLECMRCLSFRRRRILFSVC